MNVNLIRKVYFPRSILPVSAVFSWLITFGIELLVLVSAFLITGHMVLQWIPMVICVALLQTGFSLGIGLVATSLNAFYRDVEYLTNIVLQLWFWATPVVWPPTLLLDRNPAPTGHIKNVLLLQTGILCLKWAAMSPAGTRLETRR